MASGTQSVTTEGMLKAADMFSETANTVKGYLNQVRQTVDDLISTWAGQSGQGFYLAMQEWSSDCNVILKELNDMAGVMKGDAVDHQQVDDDAQNYTRQISQADQGLAGLGYSTAGSSALEPAVPSQPRAPLSDGLPLGTVGSVPRSPLIPSVPAGTLIPGIPGSPPAPSAWNDASTPLGRTS